MPLADWPTSHSWGDKNTRAPCQSTDDAEMNSHIRPNKMKRHIFLELKFGKESRTSENYFGIKFGYPNACQSKFFQGEKKLQVFSTRPPTPKVPALL